MIDALFDVLFWLWKNAFKIVILVAVFWLGKSCPPTSEPESIYLLMPDSLTYKVWEKLHNISTHWWEKPFVVYETIPRVDTVRRYKIDTVEIAKFDSLNGIIYIKSERKFIYIETFDRFGGFVHSACLPRKGQNFEFRATTRPLPVVKFWDHISFKLSILGGSEILPEPRLYTGLMGEMQYRRFGLEAYLRTDGVGAGIKFCLWRL